MNILEISTVQEQTVLENGYVVFENTDIAHGCAIRHVNGTDNVNIPTTGVYKIFFSADFLPVAAGDITVTLENNGVPIASTVFTGVLNVQKRISFMRAIDVRRSCACVNNTANLKIRSSEAVTVSNATLLIDRKE